MSTDEIDHWDPPSLTGAPELDALADGILVLDDAGTITYANRAACRMLGTRDAVGLSFGRPLVDDGHQVIEVLGAERQARDADVTISSLASSGLPGWVLSLRLLHERTDPLAMSYHDLRNSLGSVTLAVDTLDDDGLDAAQRTHVLRLLRRRLARVSTNIEGYLEASRFRDGFFTPARTATPVRQAISDYLLDVRPGLDDVTVAVSHSLHVQVGVSHLVAVIDNYVANALKYAPGPIRITAYEQAGWVSLQVLDRGPGVPEDKALQLFDRFVRAHTESGQSGSGLGLWIVRSLAEAYGGAAGHSPRPDGGSCFWAILPGSLDSDPAQRPIGPLVG